MDKPNKGEIGTRKSPKLNSLGGIYETVMSENREHFQFSYSSMPKSEQQVAQWEPLLCLLCSGTYENRDKKSVSQVLCFDSYQRT